MKWNILKSYMRLNMTHLMRKYLNLILLDRIYILIDKYFEKIIYFCIVLYTNGSRALYMRMRGVPYCIAYGRLWIMGWWHVSLYTHTCYFRHQNTIHVWLNILSSLVMKYLYWQFFIFLKLLHDARYWIIHFLNDIRKQCSYFISTNEKQWIVYGNSKKCIYNWSSIAKFDYFRNIAPKCYMNYAAIWNNFAFQ